VRQHCHRAVRLSDAVDLGPLARAETCFVHGVAEAFLARGDAAAAAGAAGARLARPSSLSNLLKLAAPKPPKPRAGAAGVADATQNADPAPRAGGFTKGAYFLGKALWAKGFAELLDRFEEHGAACAARGSLRPEVDVFGAGEQLAEIRAAAARRALDNLAFRGAKDHLSDDMAAYQVFVNPSTSDVVATTSAEALAMGALPLLLSSLP
jgi:digalactosyldiacylglycerol synthase